mgnify:CR=1 FL=1
MKIHWPYQLLLLLFLASAAILTTSPSIAVQTLAAAVNTNDKQNWPNLVNQEYLKEYNRTLLEGLIRTKMNLEIRSRKVGRATAMQDFTFAMSGINRLADKLSNPQGFKHTLCGEVARFPNFPEKTSSDCWAMEGEWHWQSPTLINVDYKNPATGWTTQLQLQRRGLLNWQAVSIELPIDKILKQLEMQITAI